MDLKGGKFMDPRTFPTKGNLMLAKNSLSLARQGYDLMDKKRNILIRELMDLIEEARTIQEDIDSTFMYAYQCLQRANIENGISTVELLAYTVPIENSITIQTRSIMGTEIPHVKYVPDPGQPTYSFSTTRESIDKAREAFRKVKELTIRLSMIEKFLRLISMQQPMHRISRKEPIQPSTISRQRWQHWAYRLMETAWDLERICSQESRLCWRNLAKVK